MNTKINERGNIALFLCVSLFIGVIILGTAFFMSHNLPTVDTHATLSSICSAAQSLCTSK